MLTNNSCLEQTNITESSHCTHLTLPLHALHVHVDCGPSILRLCLKNHKSSLAQVI